MTSAKVGFALFIALAVMAFFYQAFTFAGQMVQQSVSALEQGR